MGEMAAKAVPTTCTKAGSVRGARLPKQGRGCDTPRLIARSHASRLCAFYDSFTILSHYPSNDDTFSAESLVCCYPACRRASTQQVIIGPRLAAAQSGRTSGSFRNQRFKKLSRMRNFCGYFLASDAASRHRNQVARLPEVLLPDIR